MITALKHVGLPTMKPRPLTTVLMLTAGGLRARREEVVHRVSHLYPGERPDQVFDWVSAAVPADTLVRQCARTVNCASMKAGATISTCPDDDPDLGWMVSIVVKDRQTAEWIESVWKPRVGRCQLREMRGPEKSQPAL